MKKDILLKGLVFLRVICLATALYIWGANIILLYEIDQNIVYPMLIQCLILLYIYNNINKRKIKHLYIFSTMVFIPVISVFLFYGYKSLEEQIILMIFYLIVVGIMYTKSGKVQYLHVEQKWFLRKIYLWIALITMMFLINYSATLEVINYFLILFFINLMVLNEARQKEFNIKDNATRNIYGIVILVSFVLKGWNGALNKGIMAISSVCNIIIDFIIKLIYPLIYLIYSVFLGVINLIYWVMNHLEKAENIQSNSNSSGNGFSKKNIEMDINYIRNQKIIRIIILIILIGIIVLIIIKLFKKITMQGFNSVEYKEITEELELEDKSKTEVKEIIYEGLDGKIKENFREIQLNSIPVDKYKKNMTATEFTNNIKNNDENLMYIRAIYNKVKFSDEKINQDICKEYCEKIEKILKLDVFKKKSSL